MSTYEHDNFRKSFANSLEEIGFSHEKTKGEYSFSMQKQFSCNINDCQKALTLIACVGEEHITNPELLDQIIPSGYDKTGSIPSLLFLLKHHEFAKKIYFSVPKIIIKGQSHRLIEIYVNLTRYVEDHISIFSSFKDSNPYDEFLALRWNSEEMPLAYTFFFVSPSFLDDEIKFKTCEIDNEIFSTELRLKQEPGYGNFVIRRF